MEFFKFDLITRLIADIHFKKSNNTNLRWYDTETKKLVTHSFFVMIDHGCSTINEIRNFSLSQLPCGFTGCVVFLPVVQVNINTDCAAVYVIPDYTSDSLLLESLMASTPCGLQVYSSAITISDAKQREINPQKNSGTSWI